MRINWGLICELAENKPQGLVITKPFDEGFAPSFPFVPPMFYHVASLTGRINDVHTIEARLSDPSGAIIFFSPAERVEVEKGFVPFLRGYNKVVFPKPGNYTIEILVDGKSIHSITLSLKQT